MIYRGGRAALTGPGNSVTAALPYVYPPFLLDLSPDQDLMIAHNYFRNVTCNHEI